MLPWLTVTATQAGLLESQALCFMWCSLFYKPRGAPRAWCYSLRERLTCVLCVQPWSTRSLWAVWESPDLALLPEQLKIKQLYLKGFTNSYLLTWWPETDGLEAQSFILDQGPGVLPQWAPPTRLHTKGLMEGRKGRGTSKPTARCHWYRLTQPWASCGTVCLKCC